MNLEKNKNLWLFNGNFHLTDLGTNIATNQILKLLIKNTCFDISLKPKKKNIYMRKLKQ